MTILLSTQSTLYMIKTIYWTTTSLISLILSWSAYTYFFNQATIAGVRALGFPDFFRIQLAVLKILAVIILLIPLFPAQLKEWAYAGVGLFFVTAIVAHAVHKDPIYISLINVLFIGLLVLSYMYWHKVMRL